MRNISIAWLWATSLALAGEETGRQDSVSQPMQVEEPGSAPLAPVNPDREKSGWKGKEKDRQDLTPAQKLALSERRQRVKAMTLLIQEKREAIRMAKDGEREALTQELHNLVIEGDVGEKGDLSEARGELLDNRLKQLENQQEWLRRKEAKQKKFEEKVGPKVKPQNRSAD